MDYVFELFKLDNTEQPIVLHSIKSDNNYEPEINWHRNIEIWMGTEGKGTATIDADTYELCKGDILVVNSCSIHAVKTDNMVEYYCLIIDPDFCTDNGINFEDVVFEIRIDDDKMRELFSNVVHEYKSDDPYRYAGIRSSVLSLVLYMARNHAVKEIKGKGRASGKVLENMRIAIGYIKNHYTENITIDRVCKEVGLSKYHFVREFKKIIGVTPVNYINSLRIEKAKKMLLLGDHKISEIQDMCGFENASYFTALFRRVTGITPSEFSKNKTRT